MPVVYRRGDANLALQALCLSKAFPSSSAELTRGHLIWTGSVRPLDLCDTYLLRLEAEHARVPSIYVMEPELIANESGLLPHVYDTGSLCVSDLGDFRPGMLFVDTVLPWTLEWLIHYEQWRATGTWYGDGPDRLDGDSQADVLHPYSPEQAPSSVRGSVRLPAPINAPSRPRRASATARSTTNARHR
ncbi:hypothetical protein EDD32_3060 [Georgenia muralis]|uniref:Type II CBASS E2 protein domain-containing protein n=1 Tax=Georgenia muralis TaxID=154117 RepID=A0A3N4ZBB2_9MICO|nr:hypothetical protein EDD32_3060 [Georgenia muralis]